MTPHYLDHPRFWRLPIPPKNWIETFVKWNGLSLVPGPSGV
jgi:hypothetical protein